MIEQFIKTYGKQLDNTLKQKNYNENITENFINTYKEK